MNLKRIFALIISVILLAAMPMATIAEAITEPDSPNGTELQGIDISETAVQEELNEEELEAFQEIANTLAASGEETLCVEEDGATTTFSLGEAPSDENATILNAVTTTDDGAVALSTVSEIVLLNSSDSDSDDAGDEDAGAEDTEADGTASEDAGTEEEVPVEPTVPEMVEDTYGESDEVYEEVYAPEAEVPATSLGTLTMEELYSGLGGGKTDEELEAYKGTDEYKLYADFASSVGLGKDMDSVRASLNEIAEEYHTNKAAYEKYLSDYAAYEEELKTNPDAVAPTPVEEPTVPQFTLEDLEISMDKDVTASGEGYVTEITVNADAVYNVQYDGEVQVEVEVPFEGGTDFVITLDVSGSMNGSADKPMLQALKTVMEEIMANPENTVSIVFYGSGANALTLDLNGDGTLESVFNASKTSAEDIFNAKLGKTGCSLNDLLSGNSSYRNILDPIRNAFGVSSSSTHTKNGLDAAYNLLSELYGGEKPSADRNTGVMLFTDGATNNEEGVIISERKLVEDFGATVVNVALGTSTTYEDYMNPENPDYKYSSSNNNYTIKNDYTPDRELMLKENVVYYNIPKMSNDQLAAKISEMFNVAFKTITTTKGELKTGAVSDGVLAAVGSSLIDTIPATMEIVKMDGNTPSYRILGKDENGNTLIAWDLGNLYSGDELTFSYFMVPVNNNTDLKVNISSGVDTVLVTNPMDKVLNNEENTQIAIIHCVEPYNEENSQATLPKTGVASVPSSILWMGLISSMVGFVAAKRYA